MTAVVHTLYNPGTFTTYLSTGLNSLADGAYSAASPARDNSTSLHELIQFQLLLASYTPSGGIISVFMLPGDGTNYSEGGGSVVPSGSHRVWWWRPNAAAAAHPMLSDLIPFPGTHAKFVLYNGSGADLASSANTLAARTLAFQSN